MEEARPQVRHRDRHGGLVRRARVSSVEGEKRVLSLPRYFLGSSSLLSYHMVFEIVGLPKAKRVGKLFAASTSESSTVLRVHVQVFMFVH